jgi:hypothetical protein
MTKKALAKQDDPSPPPGDGKPPDARPREEDEAERIADAMSLSWGLTMDVAVRRVDGWIRDGHSPETIWGVYEKAAEEPRTEPLGYMVRLLQTDFRPGRGSQARPASEGEAPGYYFDRYHRGKYRLQHDGIAGPGSCSCCPDGGPYAGKAPPKGGP